MWHSLTWPNRWGLAWDTTHTEHNTWRKKTKQQRTKTCSVPDCWQCSWWTVVFAWYHKWGLGCATVAWGLKHSNTSHPMNPRLLLYILTWLSQVPVPDPRDALDVASWLAISNIQFSFRLHSWNTISTGLDKTWSNIEVELCAGEANLSRSMAACGRSVKCFDATWWWCSASV